ncbi:MAG: hypothetical protein LBI48_01295 [Burkholderiaceae bacterium]|jgi:hypothetical protein|nr:hypothetical protein [Burkholderiaceae bacterium]
MKTKQIDAVGSAAVSGEVDKLRTAVMNMDSLSQQGCDEIAAIAGLALTCFETTEGYRRLDDVAIALGAIRRKANDTMDCINGEAEGVGCNYVDKAERGRWAAMRAAHEQGIAA